MCSSSSNCQFRGITLGNFLVTRLQDESTEATYAVLASTRWLGLRLDLMSSVMAVVVAVAAVLTRQEAGEDTIPAARVGAGGGRKTNSEGSLICECRLHLAQVALIVV